MVILQASTPNGVTFSGTGRTFAGAVVAFAKSVPATGNIVAVCDTFYDLETIRSFMKKSTIRGFHEDLALSVSKE